MKKDISTLLQKGNLRPKERMILLVHNAVNKERTGKEQLTEADKHALSEGWTPKDNNEVAEYNRYYEGWKTTGFAEMDAQTTYLLAENNLLLAGQFMLMIQRDLGDTYAQLDKDRDQKNQTEKDEALKVILENCGLEYDYVIYRTAYESLPEPVKKDLLALYPDVATETDYLDQEEMVADLFNGKDELTKASKEKLADLMVKYIHNEYAELYKATIAKGLMKKDDTATNPFRHDFILSRYYGDLPAIEIIRKWAEYNNIDLGTTKPTAELTEKETETLKDKLLGELTAYATKHGETTDTLLQQTVLRWLDEGLLTKEYQPLFMADGKTTVNNQDTTLPHKEIFTEWLQAKQKATATIKGLVEAGKLTVAERAEQLGRGRLKDEDVFKIKRKIITGESLYHLSGDYAFTKDFRGQVDDLEILGRLVVILRGADFLEKYADLLLFLDIFKRLSAIFDIDLTYKIKKWLDDFKDEVRGLNRRLVRIGDDITTASHKKRNVFFLQKLFSEGLEINLDGVKPNQETARTKGYYKEFSKVFGDDF